VKEESERGFAGLSVAARGTAAVYVKKNTVSGNYGGIDAGGGAIEVDDNLIVDNTSVGPLLGTGRSGGTVIARRDTIMGNHALYAGAGVELAAGSGVVA
jgi:hypothetical protein